MPIYKVPWTSQPPPGTGIDWSNPLTRGLVVLACPTSGKINLVDDSEGTDYGTTGITLGVGPHGKSFIGLPTAEESNGLQWSVSAADEKSTMMSLHSQDLQNTEYSGIDRVVTSARMSNKFHTFHFAKTIFTGDAKVGSYVRDNASNVAIDGADTPYAEVTDYALEFHCCTIVSTTEARRVLNGRIASATVSIGGGYAADSFAIGKANDINIPTESEIEDVYLAAFWTRTLSDEEMLALYRNPWQLFEPRELPIGIEAGAGGGVKTASGTPSLTVPTATGSVAKDAITASGTPSLTVPTATGSVGRLTEASGTPSLTVPTATGSVAKDALSASGTPELTAPTATGSVVKDAITASGTPELTVPTSTGAVSKDALSASGTPSLTVPTATGSVAKDAITASGTPELTVPTSTGAASATAAGVKSASGTPDLTIPTATGSVAKDAITASGTPELTSPTATGSVAKDAITASGTPELTAPTATGSVAKDAITASGSPILISPTATGSVAKDAITASGTPELTGSTATGAASKVGQKAASGSPLLAIPTATGSVSKDAITASGTPELAELTASGTVTASLAASGTPTLTEITATGSVGRLLEASGTATLSDLVATGSAGITGGAPAAVGKTRHMHPFLS